MEHKPIQSSMLNSAGYEDGVLELEFSNGKRFRYQTTQEIYDGLMRSTSPGSYFHKHIRNKPAAVNNNPQQSDDDFGLF